MSRNTSRIDTSRTNDTVNAILSGSGQTSNADTRRCWYNQNEDQFLILPDTYTIPSIPVHHTMDDPVPPEGYADIIADLARFLMKESPHLLAGTRWFFDPATIHTPTFFRTVEFAGTTYLYHVLIDLACRPLECEILETGSNERTHAYRSNRLYFECDYFPLAGSGQDVHELRQTIPVTWKGEAGQGYMVHGLWMDSDINKFFSKLILPAGKRNHPYYPITCKQHCVSMNAWGQNSPAALDRFSRLVGPDLMSILEELQMTPFSETMTLFGELKNKMPADIGAEWDRLEVRAYLNERDQKEYTVEF
jgi:hypothetical protein